jgi:ribosome production factor 1
VSALQAVLPCAEYYKRQGFPLKKIVKYAANRDYSDLLVFNEDRKEVGWVLGVGVEGRGDATGQWDRKR